MTNFIQNRVDELLFSFSYTNKEKASRCNQKLERLAVPVLFPSVEESFKFLPEAGLNLELESLEINLGKIKEEDLNDSLGERIKVLIAGELARVMKENLQLEFSDSNPSGRDSSSLFGLRAIEYFFSKGYFPAWMDPSWTLEALLDQLLLNHSKDLGNLFHQIIHKGETVRKRIADLKADYFDRLISVLVPDDASFMLGLRDSFLVIQKKKSELHNPMGSLKKALNLFVLNFIAQDSGPKFNRLTFSEYFLKSIASHYNIDFKLFIVEISKLLNDNSTKGSIGRDLQEAITWVEKRNSDYPIPLEQRNFTITRDRFLKWLERPSPNQEIEEWITNRKGSNSIFSHIETKFPGIWRSLDLNALLNYLQVLAGNQGPLWKVLLTESRLLFKEFKGLSTTFYQDNLLKGVFDLAASDAATFTGSLMDWQDLYRYLGDHLITEIQENNSELAPAFTTNFIQFGLKKGIKEAPLFWSEIENLRHSPTKIPASKPYGFLENEGSELAQQLSNSVPSKIFVTSLREQVLLDYLLLGRLKASFYEVKLLHLIGQ